MALARRLQHPARLVPFAFLVAIALGTVLLMLPVSRSGPDAAPFLVALFTAVSGVCVTGLVVVDTPSYWSHFGQAVILALFQVGGFGIMTMATMLGLVVTRRLGLASKLVAQAETRSLALGDVRRVLLRIGLLALVVEAATALVLTLRFAVAYDRGFGTALWEGLFHAVSAFNNAGFALWSDSLSRFATDPWVCVPVMSALVIGGLGFPVVFELTRHWRRPRTWTIHTRITVYGTALLVVAGTVAVLAFEWRNPATLGPLDVRGKLLAATFQGVTPRTAGFNTLDYAGLHHETWLVTVWLMFVGGGPAGTAGGIKVTTFFLLGFVVWAEIRGDRDVTVFHRRLAETSQRQALTIALLAVGLVATATLTLLVATDYALDRILFEVTSAFGTVGLSTGITGDLPGLGQVVLIVLMFVGRVGPITAAGALALRERPALYRLPEERPVIA